MATYLLDTNVIIDVLNDKRNRRAWLLTLVEAGHVLACCAVNVAEVYAGMRPKEERATQQFLDSLQYHLISEQAARLAGGYKREYGRKGITLNLADALIAAVAVDQHLILLTDNTKDFPMSDLSLHPMPPDRR